MDTLQRAQVDQGIDQRVEVGDSGSIAQFGSFDAQVGGLRVDPFGSCPLLVERFVEFAIPIQLVANAGTDAGGKGGLAAAFGPVRIVDRTDFVSGVGEKERADVGSFFVFDEAGRARDVGHLERHRQTGLAQGKTVRIEDAFGCLAAGKGDGGEPMCIIKIFIDVSRVGGQGVTAHLADAALF